MDTGEAHTMEKMRKRTVMIGRLMMFVSGPESELAMDIATGPLPIPHAHG